MMKVVVPVMMVAGLVTVAALASLAACGPSLPPPPPEPPSVPLVIGTSAPASSQGGPALADDRDAGSVPSDVGIAASAVSPLDVPARDPRLNRPARMRALLVVELQQLERLFDATAAGAPDRGALARRLAEDYAELSRSAGASGGVAATAHAGALKYYDLVVTEDPKNTLIDEVYYYRGLESEMRGDLRRARSSYYDLIKNRPNSKLVPLAYFAFGEMFFAEGISDPSKYDLAEQAYKEVLKYPPPANFIYAEAKQRLDEIAARKGAKRP
jgi:tetratricopeptide (TPR) repeat protein